MIYTNVLLVNNNRAGEVMKKVEEKLLLMSK